MGLRLDFYDFCRNLFNLNIRNIELNNEIIIRSSGAKTISTGPNGYYLPSFFIVLICSTIFFGIDSDEVILKTNRLKSVDCFRG